MAEEKKVVKKDRGRWFREMRSELKKVVWPTPQKVAKNTGTVLLCSLGDTPDIPHQVPRIVGHDHLDEDVPGEHLLLHLFKWSRRPEGPPA